MDERLGDTWRQWGSEQVASNFVIANDPDPVQLPYDRYVNHWEEPLPSDPAFVHFIGTYRFRRGNYARCSKAAIAALGALNGRKRLTNSAIAIDPCTDSV